MQKKTKKAGHLEVGDTVGADRGTPQAVPAQDHPEPGGSAEVHSEAGSLNHVRNILIGPITQTFEQKLNQLEQRVDQSMRDFSEKTSVRIDKLEKRTDDGLVRLNEEIKGDRDRHSKAAEQLKQECDAAVNAMRQKVEKLFKQYESTQAEFAEATRAKMEQLSTTLTGQLDTQVGQLRCELVDRVSLASAFSEVAMRLSGAAEEMVIDEADPEIDAALANLK